VRRFAFALFACGLLGLGAAPGADAFIGPYTGVGHGSLDRVHHQEDANDPTKSNDDFVLDSHDAYEVRFTYSFRIQNDGTIQGRGDGTYQSATWHLEGQNGTNGPFNCDPPVEGKPFDLAIDGHAKDGRVHLHFHLNATEHNDQMDCGGNYTAFATTSHYMNESLDLVQGGDGVAISQTNPDIPRLHKVEQTGDANNRRTTVHDWNISIQPPPPPVESGVNGGPGTASSPSSPSTNICTIEGTAHADHLTGTPGDDVICGLGGNDVIRGRGGNDILYGSAGSDRISGGAGLDTLLGNQGDDTLLAKDHKHDFVSGGPGSDAAKLDKGKDTARSIEHLL